MIGRHKTASLKLLTTILIALGLKYHYSTAGVNDLRWILGPTAFLVELVTGMRFRFESNAGYLSDDRSFLIAPSCSGLNFLMIAFLVVALTRLWHERDSGWSLIPTSMSIGLAATLAANTTRIVIAIALQRSKVEFAGFDDQQLHRIEGIAVYFGFLILLFLIVERKRFHVTSASHFVLLFGTYYAVTLGIPLLRGSYHDPVFWQHAPYVVLVPLVIAFPFLITAAVRGRSNTTHPAHFPDRL